MNRLDIISIYDNRRYKSSILDQIKNRIDALDYTIYTIIKLKEFYNHRVTYELMITKILREDNLHSYYQQIYPNSELLVAINHQINIMNDIITLNYTYQCDVEIHDCYCDDLLDLEMDLARYEIDLRNINNRIKELENMDLAIEALDNMIV